MMLGVEFVKGSRAADSEAANTPDPEIRDRIEMECFNRGLIILGCGTSVIRWSPPLILTTENADVALEIFDAAIAACI
jgi:4-aminobutyrate aminotransferase